MTGEPDIRPVLAAYPAVCWPVQQQFLAAAGGYSGALFWRLTTACGTLCLRRWPLEHPNEERLAFIQAVLWHVHQEGFQQAPLPLETRTHAGYVRHAGHLWELTPWMPGAANFHKDPRPARLRSALETLARFHVAASSFPLPDTEPAASPGMIERRDQLRGLLSGELQRLDRAAQGTHWPELADRWPRLRSLFLQAANGVAAALEQAVTQRVTLQPCIRDVWHDHVLFEEDRVTALIDFGSLRAETVAADIARLLGSLVADDRSLWREGRQAYESVRRLGETEDLLIAAFDRSSVLMSSLSWMRWVFIEGRQFADRAAILGRVDENLCRLELLARQSPS